MVIEVLPFASRTATPVIGDFRTARGKGVVLVINAVTAGSPSVVFTLLGKDPVSGKTWTILASAAVVATGVTILKVHPGLTASTNAVANDVLPPVWTITAVHADTTAISYSITASVIVE